LAERILSFRQQHGNINASNLIEIPRLKLTRQLLDMIDFSPVGPEATAYPACIQSDVEVQDFYDYGHIETSQTPVQYKYTTKADVDDDDEDFSDEYLLKQEDEEVREHSRFPSNLRKPSDYTLNLGDHQYYSKIKTAEEIKQEELQLKRVLSRYQKLDTNMMDQVPVERKPVGRKPVHEANMENTNTKHDFSRERMIQSTPRLLNLNIDTRNPPVKPVLAPRRNTQTILRSPSPTPRRSAPSPSPYYSGNIDRHYDRRTPLSPYIVGNKASYPSSHTYYRQDPQCNQPRHKSIDMPQGLKYDGTTNWKTFYTKFQ
jgi:site-specific DNA-cytosine methylase